MEFFNQMLNLLNDGNYEEVIDRIAHFLDENPQYKTIDYYHFANPIEEVLYDGYFGDYDDINQLEFDQDLDELYLVYGIAYMYVDDMANAEKYLKIANKINPVSATILMNLCEFYQINGNYEKIEPLISEIMRYAYDDNVLVTAYFKLALYHLHVTHDMDMNNHLTSFFLGVQGHDVQDIAEHIEFLEKNNVQLGFHPEIIQIIMYLIDVFEKKDMGKSVDFFKNILDDVVEFNALVESLKII